MNNRIMVTTADIGLAHIYRALAVAKRLEQEANAKRMQELDLAVCVEEKDLETKLSQAIGIMDERKDSFSAKLRELREYAERLDGVETTVKDIESFV